MYRIRISNIFVSSNPAEYKYRIYSFLVTWPNMNIEYIRNQKTKYSYSNIKYSVLNIRIYSFYTVKLGKSQHANLKKEDNLKKGYDKKIKITSNRQMTSKWRQSEKWRWFTIEDDLKKDNVILKTIPGPS